MAKAFNKEIVRSIKQSAGRFAAIAIISFLGAGFFGGLRMAAPDMWLAGDEFFDATNLYDVAVTTTLGVDDDTLEALSEVEGVEAVSATRRVDAMAQVSGESRSIRLESLDVEAARASDTSDGQHAFSDNSTYMNRPILLAGQWPADEGECVLSADAAAKFGVNVGDSIVLQKGEEDLEDVLNVRELRVSGLVNSSAYVSMSQYGPTTMGTGQLELYGFVSDEAFAEDYPLTMAYATVAGAREMWWDTPAYDDAVAAVRSRIQDKADTLGGQRYDAVVNEAQGKLDDAREEFEEERAEALQKLADAEGELADARAKLDDAAATVVSGRATLDDSAAQLYDARQKLEQGERDYADGVAQLSQQREAAEEQFSQAQQQIDAQRAQVEVGLAQLDTLRAQRAQLAQAIEALEGQGAGAGANAGSGTAGQFDVEALANVSPDQLTPEQQAQLAQLQQLQQMQQAAQAQLAELKAQLATLDAAIAQIEQGAQALEQGQAQLDAQRAAAEAQFANAQQQLDAARATLDAGWAETNEGMRQYANGLVDWENGRGEYLDGEASYADGLAEYVEERDKAMAELDDAQRELDDAQADIDDIEHPDVFVMDRSKNVGAATLTSDADGIRQIASFFPLMFFLVAALVCLTSMTRMVDEERLDIGTHKALGYGKARITSKYLIYAVLASGIGSVAGVVALGKLLPYFVLTSYQTAYALPIVPLPLDPVISALAIGLSVGVCAAATWWAAASSLRSRPATLMLPRAPKAGKRIVLERIRPLWNRMSFSQKVTARNLLRYKKRFFMAVIGVAGCTALLLMGFGLRDAIGGIVQNQYQNLQTYDMVVRVDDDIADDDRAALLEVLSGREGISYLPVHQESLIAHVDGADDLRIQVVVPQDADALAQFVTLRDRPTQQALSLGGGAMVLTEKAATMLNAQVGAQVSLFEQNDVGDATGEGMSFAMGGVAENYLGHYAYLLPDDFEQATGKECAFDTYFVSVGEGDVEQLAQELRDCAGVATVSQVARNVVLYESMLDIMNNLIFIIVVAAAALAFVVLYNLTNINIDERIREIATLKVLGFTRGEVGDYIFREVFIMALLGAVIGCVAGVPLTLYVAVAAETPLMMFGRTIEPLSFVLAFVLTLAFTVLVALAMRRKLARVSMVESLKSID